MPLYRRDHILDSHKALRITNRVRLDAGLGHNHMAALPAVVTGARLQYNNSEKSVSIRHTRIG